MLIEHCLSLAVNGYARSTYVRVWTASWWRSVVNMIESIWYPLFCNANRAGQCHTVVLLSPKQFHCRRRQTQNTNPCRLDKDDRRMAESMCVPEIIAKMTIEMFSLLCSMQELLLGKKEIDNGTTNNSTRPASRQLHRGGKYTIVLFSKLSEIRNYRITRNTPKTVLCMMYKTITVGLIWMTLWLEG